MYHHITNSNTSNSIPLPAHCLVAVLGLTSLAACDNQASKLASAKKKWAWRENAYTSMLVICFERNLIQHSHRCHGLVSWLGHRIHFRWFVIIIPRWGANKGPLSWDLEGVNIWATCHIQMDIVDIFSIKNLTHQ